MIDYNAPGRKSGLAGLFQRLRCGGQIGMMKGHTLEWDDSIRDRYLRCRECGHVVEIEPLWMKEYEDSDYTP